MDTDVGRQSKIVFPSTMTEYFSYTVFSGMIGTTHPALIIIDTSFMVSSPSDSKAIKTWFESYPIVINNYCTVGCVLNCLISGIAKPLLISLLKVFALI